MRNMRGARAKSSNFIPDMGGTQEVAIDYAANSAEAITGGVTINYIPREGGNSFKGALFVNAVNSDFQGSNYTTELAAQGLRTPNSLKFAKPTSTRPAAVRSSRTSCGSIRRCAGSKQQTYVAGLWNNLNAGDPDRSGTTCPTLNHQAVFALEQYSVNTRLSWQADAEDTSCTMYLRAPDDETTTTSGRLLSPESSQHWAFPQELADANGQRGRRR